MTRKDSSDTLTQILGITVTSFSNFYHLKTQSWSFTKEFRILVFNDWPTVRKRIPKRLPQRGFLTHHMQQSRPQKSHNIYHSKIDEYSRQDLQLIVKVSRCTQKKRFCCRYFLNENLQFHLGQSAFFLELYSLYKHLMKDPWWCVEYTLEVDLQLHLHYPSCPSSRRLLHVQHLLSQEKG